MSQWVEQKALCLDDSALQAWDDNIAEGSLWVKHNMAWDTLCGQHTGE